MTKIEDIDPSDHEGIVEAFFESEEGFEPEATEPTEIEAVPTMDPAGDPEDEDEVSDEGSEEPVTASEAPEEEEGEDDPDKDLSPAEKFLSKRLRDQQAFHDRKMAAVEQQLSQMNQWAQQVYQQQMAAQQAQMQAQQAAAQQAPAQQHVSDAQLAQAVDEDPERAFVWVGQNRPELMPKLISLTRQNEKYGHTVADTMQHEFTQYQIQQVAQAQQAQYEAQRQAQLDAQAPIQMEQAMSELISDFATSHGDAFTSVQDEFVARAGQTIPEFKEYMARNNLAMTPDAVQYFLGRTLQDVREAKMAENASKPRKARKVAADEHVETSTSGKGPEEVTADEDAISELLKGAQALSMDFTAPTR